MLSDTITVLPLRAQPERGQAPARCCPDRDIYPVAPRTLGSLVKSVQPHEPIPTQGRLLHSLLADSRRCTNGCCGATRDRSRPRALWVTGVQNRTARGERAI